MIDSWIKAIKRKIITDKKAIRKTVTIRADDWRARYLRATNQTSLYHLQMVSLQGDLWKAMGPIAAPNEIISNFKLSYRRERSSALIRRVTIDGSSFTPTEAAPFGSSSSQARCAKPQHETLNEHLLPAYQNTRQQDAVDLSQILHD